MHLCVDGSDAAKNRECSDTCDREFLHRRLSHRKLSFAPPEKQARQFVPRLLLFLPFRTALQSFAASSAARLMGVTAATVSTTNATDGRRRLLRSSSVVGRQPKRRHVSATDVATAGT